MLGHLLDPDSPSKDELWVEKRVEELEGNLSFELATANLPDWFDACIDWESVRTELSAQATLELEEMKAQAAISAWEDRQAARDAECFGW